MREEGMKESYALKSNIRDKGKKWLRAIEKLGKRRDDFEIEPSKSALMVIDMQEYFLSADSHAFIPSSKAIVPNIERLLKAYRKIGHPVIFTRHALKNDDEPGIMGRWWADVIREGDSFSKITSVLRPLKSEVVLRKTRYSAFQGTDLEKLLRERGIESLVITGLMTHLCCESTAREAFMKDFEVYFIVDATVSQYEELHLSSLKTLSDGFAIPLTTDELLRKLGGENVE